MPRKKADQDPEIAQAFLVKMTPNQVVAWNLAAAREWRGWTQDQFAERLEEYLGVRWSKASVSAAERSVNGPPVRNFNADEIVAFARTFDLPIGWFFMPPAPFAAPGIPIKLDVSDDEFGAAMTELLDLVIGDAEGQSLLFQRFRSFLQAAERSYPLTDAQLRIVGMVQARVEALVAHSFSDLGNWQTMLRSLANQLEDLQVRAGRIVSEQVRQEYVGDLFDPSHSARPGGDAGTEGAA